MLSIPKPRPQAAVNHSQTTPPSCCHSHAPHAASLIPKPRPHPTQLSIKPKPRPPAALRLPPFPSRGSSSGAARRGRGSARSPTWRRHRGCPGASRSFPKAPGGSRNLPWVSRSFRDRGGFVRELPVPFPASPGACGLRGGGVAFESAARMRRVGVVSAPRACAERPWHQRRERGGVACASLCACAEDARPKFKGPAPPFC